MASLIWMSICDGTECVSPPSPTRSPPSQHLQNTAQTSHAADTAGGKLHFCGQEWLQKSFPGGAALARRTGPTVCFTVCAGVFLSPPRPDLPPLCEPLHGVHHVTSAWSWAGCWLTSCWSWATACMCRSQTRKLLKGSSFSAESLSAYSGAPSAPHSVKWILWRSGFHPRGGEMCLWLICGAIRIKWSWMNPLRKQENEVWNQNKMLFSPVTCEQLMFTSCTLWPWATNWLATKPPSLRRMWCKAFCLHFLQDFDKRDKKTSELIFGQRQSSDFFPGFVSN